MKFIDHGEWVAYKPENHPLRQHVDGHKLLFCKRKTDGVDWYDYRKATGIVHPSGDRVLVTILRQFNPLIQKDEWVVMTTAREEPEFIWPEGTRLIEIAFDGDHEKLRQQRFDFDKGEFRDPPPLPDTKRPLLYALAQELEIDEHQLAQILRSRHG
jgi:hypothetical protein